MITSTVRIGAKTREDLRKVSELTGQSMQEILAQAVEDYRRKIFLERANAAFAALRDNAKAWKQEQDERAAWDVTLDDGQEGR